MCDCKRVSFRPSLNEHSTTLVKKVNNILLSFCDTFFKTCSSTSLTQQGTAFKSGRWRERSGTYSIHEIGLKCPNDDDPRRKGLEIGWSFDMRTFLCRSSRRLVNAANEEEEEKHPKNFLLCRNSFFSSHSLSASVIKNCLARSATFSFSLFRVKL